LRRAPATFQIAQMGRTMGSGPVTSALGARRRDPIRRQIYMASGSIGGGLRKSRRVRLILQLIRTFDNIV
jgi:hypothetical protein